MKAHKTEVRNLSLGGIEIQHVTNERQKLCVSLKFLDQTFTKMIYSKPNEWWGLKIDLC